LNKKKIFGIIKWLWLIFVLIAAGYYFYRNREEVTNLITEIKLWRITLSLLLLLVGKMLIVKLVELSVNTEGWHPKYMEALGVYGLSSLGKYIPGGIWHFVGRIGVYKVNGLSAKAITRALILENIWLLGSAVAIGLTGVFLTRFDLIANLLNLPNNFWLGVLFAILSLAIWIGLLAIVHNLIGKHTTEPLPNLFMVSGIGILLWMFIGGSFFMMFQDYHFTTAPIFIGGYAVSWAVGYIAVFAPGGLGIREAVLAFVFSNIATVDLIAVYAAMNRIIWVVAELLFGLIGMVQSKSMTPVLDQTGQEEKKQENIENNEATVSLMPKTESEDLLSAEIETTEQQ
jgi:hypothetical protein